jgi:hypothetical protein
MTGWVFKTEFVTDTPLEHGNWSSVEFETAEEAWAWWAAPNTKSTYPRHMTMTAPDGTVVKSRFVPVVGTE